jgi:hypothetical protein
MILNAHSMRAHHQMYTSHPRNAKLTQPTLNTIISILNPKPYRLCNPIWLQYYEATRYHEHLGVNL